ncbi:putative S-protein [Cardamine amara subsp. amara]|uniref:S-protein homolog n=1 Tax=Cardamine amara subsp. amara TaxID=228776 RepID=A0ABD0ZI23_CARAN
MAFPCNHQTVKLMIYSFVLYVSLSSLLAFSDAAASEEAVTRARGLLPLQKKTITIANVVRNREVLNLHCKSSENDLGLQHIRFARGWTFKFRVNWKGTTKFRCHLTWRGGGDHWFTIFKDRRDNCDLCAWQVLGDGGKEKPMIRTRWWKGYLRGNNDYYDWDT